MEQYFDRIIEHLKRKKPIKTRPQHHDETEWKVSKPIIQISDDGKSLWCDYGRHYLYIHYNDEKVYNPYEISIESQCVIARFQTVGVRDFSDIAPTQEDVIECIRYRLRSK